MLYSDLQQRVTTSYISYIMYLLTHATRIYNTTTTTTTHHNKKKNNNTQKQQEPDI